MSGMLRRKDITPDDVLDRIFKAWISHRVDEDLSLQDRWILERMEFIDARLKEGGERSRTKFLIEDVYEEFKVHNITRRTIETDIARTKRFFLTVRPRDDKEYAKGKYIEWGERRLHQLELDGNDKEWNKLYAYLINLQGFTEPDLDAPDYDAIQPPPLMVVMDPGDIGVPVIDNLEEEIRILNMPKKDHRNTDNIDEAEDVSGSE